MTRSSHVETIPYHDLQLTDSSFIFPQKNCTTPTICVFAETTPTIEFFVLPARLLGLPDVGGKFLQVEEDLKEAMLAHLKKDTI